jgi:hypothetical protein
LLREEQRKNIEQLVGRSGLIVTMIKTTRTARKTKTDMMKPEPIKAETMKVEPAKIEAVKPEPAKAMSIKIEPVQSSAPVKVNHISLSLLKADAKKVCVAGTFNEWKPERTPLKPAGNGRWVGDLTVDPGKYEYLFVVDGQWLPDPNAKESVQNPFGGRNSVLVVSA